VVFNRVPDIDHAFRDLPFLEESVVPRLAALLVGQSRFNICVAHRHFPLYSSSEQVVELKNLNGGPVSSVFKNGAPDPLIVERYNLDVPKELSIVPDTFAWKKQRLNNASMQPAISSAAF
jgi:hypothetical protein